MLSHDHPELAGSPYVVFVDSSRQYTDCSPAICDLIGYTREELLRMRIENISYDARVEQLFFAYLEHGAQEGDFVLQRRDRTPIPIRYRAFIFPDKCNAAIWQPIDDWRKPYFAALLETDPAKLPAKIAEALDAIAQYPAPNQFTQRLLESAALNVRRLAKSKHSRP